MYLTQILQQTMFSFVLPGKRGRAHWGKHGGGEGRGWLSFHALRTVCKCFLKPNLKVAFSYVDFHVQMSHITIYISSYLSVCRCAYVYKHMCTHIYVCLYNGYGLQSERLHAWAIEDNLGLWFKRAFFESPKESLSPSKREITLNYLFSYNYFSWKSICSKNRKAIVDTASLKIGSLLSVPLKFLLNPKCFIPILEWVPSIKINYCPWESLHYIILTWKHVNHVCCCLPAQPCPFSWGTNL